MFVRPQYYIQHVLVKNSECKHKITKNNWFTRKLVHNDQRNMVIEELLFL